MTKVILNGTGYVFKYDMISYDDIVRFALEDTREDAVYTITYSKGLLGASGSMVKGDVIPIVTDMIFNAVITGNC